VKLQSIWSGFRPVIGRSIPDRLGQSVLGFEDIHFVNKAVPQDGLNTVKPGAC